MGVSRQILQALFSPTTRARLAKLSCSDQLLMTLMYWREYPTQYYIAQAYAVSESTACRTIQRVENRLIQCRQFRRPSKSELLESQTNIQGVIVDVTEQPIERPKKNSADITAARKKHTQQAQLIINQHSGQIIATAFSRVSKHDFQLFKDSQTTISQQISCLADSGYQGWANLHAKSWRPKKKSKHHPLSRQEKMTNQHLARGRIQIEHVIGRLKVFAILCQRYRNRQRF